MRREVPWARALSLRGKNPDACFSGASPRGKQAPPFLVVVFFRVHGLRLIRLRRPLPSCGRLIPACQPAAGTPNAARLANRVPRQPRAALESVAAPPEGLSASLQRAPACSHPTPSTQRALSQVLVQTLQHLTERPVDGEPLQHRPPRQDDGCVSNPWPQRQAVTGHARRTRRPRSSRRSTSAQSCSPCLAQLRSRCTQSVGGAQGRMHTQTQQARARSVAAAAPTRSQAALKPCNGAGASAQCSVCRRAPPALPSPLLAPSYVLGAARVRAPPPTCSRYQHAGRGSTARGALRLLVALSRRRCAAAGVPNGGRGCARRCGPAWPAGPAGPPPYQPARACRKCRECTAHDRRRRAAALQHAQPAEGGVYAAHRSGKPARPVALRKAHGLGQASQALRQQGNKVSMYVCGVTVYDYRCAVCGKRSRCPPRADFATRGASALRSHIGHARVYVAFDTLLRSLRRRGYDVTCVPGAAALHTMRTHAPTAAADAARALQLRAQLHRRRRQDHPPCG